MANETEIETLPEVEQVDAPVEPTEVEGPKGYELTLSKANKLRNVIEAEIQSLKHKVLQFQNKTITINQFSTAESVQKEIDETKLEYVNALTMYGNLNHILTILRTLIAKANAMGGVNEIIGEIKKIDSVLTLAQNVSLRVVGHTEKEINDIITWNKNVARSEPTSQVGSMPFMSRNVSVLSKEEVKEEENNISSLNKSRRLLEERRNELNYQHAVLLEESHASYLQALNLL